MIRPRFIAHAWASMFGWFWLPCPICGRMFAGFESGEVTVPGEPNDLIACKRHDREASACGR